MALSLVAVGQKITAAIMNAVIGAVNTVGLVTAPPASVAGTGVSLSPVGAAVTLSAATTASLNGVFTSAYANYRIVINVTLASAATINFVLRAAGTDSTAANYDHQRLVGVGSTASASQALGAAFWAISPAGATLSAYTLTIDLYGPQLASATTGILQTFAWANPLTASAGLQTGGMSHRLTTAFDGFTISSNAMTGTVQVYGYNQG